MLSHFPFTTSKDLKKITAHAKVLVVMVMLLPCSNPEWFLLEDLWQKPTQLLNVFIKNINKKGLHKPAAFYICTNAMRQSRCTQCISTEAAVNLSALLTDCVAAGKSFCDLVLRYWITSRNFTGKPSRNLLSIDLEISRGNKFLSSSPRKHLKHKYEESGRFDTHGYIIPAVHGKACKVGLIYGHWRPRIRRKKTKVRAVAFEVSANAFMVCCRNNWSIPGNTEDLMVSGWKNTKCW